MTAKGIGGQSKPFLLSAEIPIAFQGVSGLLTIHVLDETVPPLLPCKFCRDLGMILDMPNNDIHWTTLGDVHSEMHDVAGTHVAINLFEFPIKGWKIHIRTRVTSP